MIPLLDTIYICTPHLKHGAYKASRPFGNAIRRQEIEANR